MARNLITSYKAVINPSIPILKDSIPMPSNVRVVRQICPLLMNGTNHGCHGFLSVNNENSNISVLNTVKVSADKRHWNKKAIDVNVEPKGDNFSFVLNVSDVDKTQACKFMLLIKYEE